MSCPFSSSTLNIALGNGSRIVPWTSIFSSFAIVVIRQYTLLSYFSQYFWPLLRNSDRVLKVGRPRSISCYCGPSIIKYTDIRAACVNHGLYSQSHTLPEPGPLASPTVIGHLRVLMQRAPYPVPHKSPDNGIAVLLDMYLYGRRNIADPVPYNCFFYSKHQCFFSDLQ